MTLGATSIDPGRHRGGTPGAPRAPLQGRFQGEVLRLFSTLTTLGTALDVTLQEIRIETFFAADARTAEIIEGLAGGG